MRPGNHLLAEFSLRENFKTAAGQLSDRKNFISSEFVHTSVKFIFLSLPQDIMQKDMYECIGVYMIFFFLNSILHPFQDYFSSYETGQSVGGAKTGEPQEKPPDTPASRTWLVSHLARAGLEPTPVTAVR